MNVLFLCCRSGRSAEQDAVDPESGKELKTDRLLLIRFHKEVLNPFFGSERRLVSGLHREYYKLLSQSLDKWPGSGIPLYFYVVESLRLIMRGLYSQAELVSRLAEHFTICTKPCSVYMNDSFCYRFSTVEDEFEAVRSTFSNLFEDTRKFSQRI